MVANIDKILTDFSNGKKDSLNDEKYFYPAIQKCKTTDIIKSIQEILKDCCYPKPNYPLHKESRYRITPDRLSAIQSGKKGEEAVERYIMTANGDELCNQWNVGKRKECVDLVYVNENNEYSLIELKIARQDSEPDSPLLAFFESIKNYCLVKNLNKKFNEHFKVNELIILAPKTYYEKLVKTDKKMFEEFLNFIEYYNNKYKIKIRILYIDICEDYLIKNIIKHEKHRLEGKFIRCLPCVKLENWKEINKKNWNILCS